MSSVERAVRWKRSSGHYVDSHCGRWWITPVYGGLTQPESYILRRNHAGIARAEASPFTLDLPRGAAPLTFQSQMQWETVGSGQTQRECKEVAESKND